MSKIYVIIESYDDVEGYSHNKLYDDKYYLSKEDAQKEIDRIVAESQTDWEDPTPDLYVEELTKASEN